MDDISKIQLILNLDKDFSFLKYFNKINLISSLNVVNISNIDIDSLNITISSFPKFFDEYTINLDNLNVGYENLIVDFPLNIDSKFLTEILNTTKSTIFVKGFLESSLECEYQYEIELLPFNYFKIFNLNQELSACFIIKNNQFIDYIISKAKIDFNPNKIEFNGYKISSQIDVINQISSIYNAFKSYNFKYNELLLDKKNNYFNVQLPNEIAETNSYNSLEFALLFLGIIEKLELKGLLIVYENKIIPGVYLDPSDDLTVLSPLSNYQIFYDEVVVKETILPIDLSIEDNNFINIINLTFTDIKTNKQDSKFHFLIDISQARNNGYLSLPNFEFEDNHYIFDEKLLDNLEDKTISISTSHRYENWKRELLAFTSRSKLINFNIKDTSSGLPLINKNIEKLYKEILNGKKYSISPILKSMDDFDLSNPDSYISSTNETIISEDFNNNILISNLAETPLLNNVKNLSRKSKAAYEELGANIIFLSFGLIKWKKSVGRKNEEKYYYSPVILIPIEITNTISNKKVYIKYTNDEVLLNLSIIEYLKSEFQIDSHILEDYFKDKTNSELDLVEVLNIVRDMISSYESWSLLNISGIADFNFPTFVLWNDLNVREKQIKSHKVIKGLLSGTYDNTEIDTSDNQVYLPLDSDASQKEVIKYSNYGKSFIVYGPPGTGKSHTITNIIASSIAKGKSVLFIAEKMAALEVVKNRLDSLNLFDFCLELHSNKVIKEAFFSQFKNKESLIKNAVDSNYEANLKTLDQLSNELNEYNVSIYNKRNIGYSLYDLINIYLEIEDTQVIQFEYDINKVSASDYNEALEYLNSLASIGLVLNEPINSSFYNCQAVDWDIKIQENFVNVLNEIKIKSDKLIENSELVYYIFPENSDLKFRKMIKTLDFLNDYNKKNWLNKAISNIFNKTVNIRKIKSVNKWVKNNTDNSINFVDYFNSIFNSEDKLRNILVYPEISTNYGLTLYNNITNYSNNIYGLRNYVEYNKIFNRHTKFPFLDKFVDLYHKGSISSGDLVNVFKKNFLKQYIQNVMVSENVLKKNINTLCDIRTNYKALLTLVTKITKDKIYLESVNRIPRYNDIKASSAQSSILNKAIESRGRGISIRQLFSKTKELIRKIKPCLLMSPVSVAQYLPEDYPEFDLVIFDEASQLPTCSAVGAISRGKEVIVVGDSKQLPPTPFFKMQSNDSDIIYEDKDLESILDDMKALDVDYKYLLCHYRSAHESLISFSNKEYYNGELITFPSTDKTTSKVEFIKVEGVYDRGFERVNKKEAEAVVNYLFLQLNNESTSNNTFGIVTFNINQANLIQDMIDSRLITSSHLKSHFDRDFEPVFVKNIESVQGDERDIIIFSITYGYDKDNKMTSSFGPINNAGGHRRLNVAITRAKKEIKVFSSIYPEDIKITLGKNRGVSDLKKFLTYSRSIDDYYKINYSSIKKDIVVKQIEEMLIKDNYIVETGVGKSSNKVDIAVLDSNNNYEFGLLIDDSFEANSQSTRDREYGIEKYLEKVGWKIFKVFVLEWYQNREVEYKRIKKFLNNEIENHENAVFNSLLNSNETTTISQDLPYLEYQITNLPILTKEHESDEYKKCRLITNIVRTESPIAISLLTRKLAQVYSRKLTDSFTKQIENLIKEKTSFYIETEWYQKFIWVNESEKFGLKKYRTNDVIKRTGNQISKIEYKLAIFYYIQNSISISKEDLINGILRTFSLTSRNDENVEIIKNIIEIMINVNELLYINNLITINDKY